jgi:hypothetical protein
MTVPEDQIKDIKADVTMVGGKVVFQRRAAASSCNNVPAENAHHEFELIQKPYAGEAPSRSVRRAIAENAPLLRWKRRSGMAHPAHFAN